MLEEKNDNLQEADGALENANQMTTSTQSQDFENSMNNAAVEAISSEVAAQGESDIKNISQIPIENYESMAMEDIVTSLESLVQNEQIMAFKSHIEEAKTTFLSKYYEFIDEKRAQFEAENADTNEEFQYHFPLKNKFDQLYTLFKDQKNKHFKSLQNDLQANLNKRLEIVEELKNLVGAQDNIPNALKQLNDLRERWKNAGAIPKDKYNHVWNNYHFHIENFYDFLHLDREARDLDFKHNLDLKLKIIARCEQLLSETDLNKAFRELQDLHRMWKEDIGPVSKEHREEIWIKFSDLTKQMHDKREQMYEQVRLIEQDNLSQKTIIIEALEVLAKHKVDSHNLWLAQIDQVEALRNAFFQVGKVPMEVNEATWQRFKNAVKDFNTLKNSFYKEIKKDQHDNLSKKQALVAKANELKDSTDFELTTPIMKQIQDEWKTIGHVPRKISDSLWKEFREACNHYFEKLKEFKSIENTDEVEAFEKKKDYMEVIRAFEMTGDHRTDLNAIKVHIDNWKSFGKVPFTRRHIDGKFNKILDALFEKLSLSKKESEMVRFSNKLEQISESNDSRKLENEKIFIIRKIEEVQSEIFQLENNIQFFANTRNAKKENSIVLEVRKNIEKHKEELVLLKDKLKQIRNFKSEE